MKLKRRQSSAKRFVRDKVAKTRLSAEEYSAVARAAAEAGMTMSMFWRSLVLEGAGIRPFLPREDRAIIQLLGQDLRTVGNNLNQVARSLNAGRSVPDAELTGAIDDARAIAVTVAAELASMTKRAGAARRGEVT